MNASYSTLCTTTEAACGEWGGGGIPLLKEQIVK